MKKRFDDIFDSTRYAKALEAIRKSKLEYSQLKNAINADLAAFSANLKSAEGLKGDLEAAEDKMKALEEKRNDYDGRLAEQEGKLKEYEEALSGIEDLRDSLAQKTKELDTLREVTESQRLMLEEDMEGLRDDELQKMLDEFDDTAVDLEGSHQAKIDEFEALKSKRDGLQNSRIEKCSLRGTLSAALDAHNMTVVQRDSLVEAMSEKYEIPASPVENFLSGLRAKQKEFASDISLLKSANLKEDDKVQRDLADLHAKARHIEETRASNTADRLKFESQLQQVSNDASSQPRISKAEVEDAARTAEKLTEERDTLSKNARLDEIPKEIKANDTKIHGLQISIEDFNEAVEQLRNCADEEKAVSMLESQVKQDTVRLEENCKDLQHRFNEFDQCTDLSQMSQITSEPLNLNTLEAAYNSIHDKVAVLKQRFSDMNKDLAGKQKELTEKSTLLNRDKGAVATLKARVAQLQAPNSGVAKIKGVAQALKDKEIAKGKSSTIPDDLDKLDVEELLQTMRSALQQLVVKTEILSEAGVERFFKKLRKIIVKKSQGMRMGAVR